MILILFLLLNQNISAKKEILTTKDFFAEISISQNKKITNIKKIFIPEGTVLELKETLRKYWFEIFNKNKSIGYIEQNCAKINNKHNLVTTKICPLYSYANKQLAAKKELLKNNKYNNFKIHNKIKYKVLYKKKTFNISSDFAKFITTNLKNTTFYEKTDFPQLFKYKKENSSPIQSSAIDKFLYISTNKGVFVSKDSKSWYKIKALKNKFYTIAVTNTGELIANNLISSNYGEYFNIFFPKYAFPHKDSFIKKITTNTNKEIYLTFAQYSDKNNISIFIYNKQKNEWRKVYPTIKEKVSIIKVKNKDIVSNQFIKEWSKNNKQYKIRKKYIYQEEENIHIVLFLKDKKKHLDLYVTMNIKYSKQNNTWQKISTIKKYL